MHEGLGLMSVIYFGHVIQHNTVSYGITKYDID